MKLRVNGSEIEVPEGRAEASLQEFLREELDLIGTKSACQIGVCGGCAVLVDRGPVKACRLWLGDVAGKEILTIEGMAGADGTLHPLQQAFVDHGAIQCGYCTPGMVLAAHAFLLEHPSPTRAEIRHAIRGNLCRCTGYQQIVDAVEAASAHYRPQAEVKTGAGARGAGAR